VNIRQLIARLIKESASLTGKTLFLSAARIVSLGVNILTPFVLVRILSKHEFGVYGIAFLAVSTVHDLVGFNFSNSAAFFIPRKELDRDKVLATILCFNLVVGVVVMGVVWLAPGLITWVFGSSDLAPLLPLIAMVLLVWNLSRAMALVPIALGKSAVSATYIAATESSKSLFVLIPALLNPSVESVLWGFLTWSVCRCAVVLYYFHGKLGIRLGGFDKATFLRMSRYAAPHAVTGVIVIVFQRYHHFLVTHFFDEETYAVYRNGVMQLPFIMILLESANSIMIPEIAKYQAAGDSESSIALSARVFVRLAVFFLPAVLFLEVVAEEFITALFTIQYLDSVPILRVNLLQLPLLMIVMDPVMRGVEALKYFRIKVFGLGLVVLIVFGEAAVMKYGPIGAVWLTLAVLAAGQFVSALRVRSTLGMGWRHLKHFKELGYVARGCAGALGVVWAVRSGLLSWPWLIDTCGPFMRSAIVLAICGVAFTVAYGVCFEGGFRLKRTREMLGMFRGAG
jgi:O-antigen/teichoic acid export membrane protein